MTCLPQFHDNCLCSSGTDPARLLYLRPIQDLRPVTYQEAPWGSFTLRFLPFWLNLGYNRAIFCWNYCLGKEEPVYDSFLSLCQAQNGLREPRWWGAEHIHLVEEVKRKEDGGQRGWDSGGVPRWEGSSSGQAAGWPGAARAGRQRRRLWTLLTPCSVTCSLLYLLTSTP